MPTAIYTKADRKKVLQLVTQLIGVLERWRPVGSNEIKSLERLLIEVRGFVLDHLDSHDYTGCAGSNQ